MEWVNFDNVYEISSGLRTGCSRNAVEESLEKQLGKLKTYSVKGSYMYHGDKNEFKGLFRVDENKYLLGRIVEGIDEKVAEILNTEYHIIAGKVTNLDNPQIKFVKIPINSWAAPIHYSLKKSDGLKKIEGSYDAFWSFKQEDVGMPNTWLNHFEQGNTAKFELYEKLV